MTAFGEQARELMVARGVSLRELARRTFYDKAHLSRVLNGHKPASPELAERLDAELGGDGSLAALVPDPDTWERFLRAVDQPRRTDPAVVGHLARVLAEYRRLEDRTGPRPVVEPIRAQLALLDELAADARGSVRDSVVELIAHHAQFAGWLAEDTGNSGRALASYDRAMDAAQQVGDPNMITSALSMKSHLAWSRGQAARAVALAQAGRRVTGRVSPGVLALVAQQQARGHAQLGDADASDRAIDASQTLTSQAGERPEDEPPWVYFHDPGRALFQRAVADLELGRGRRAAELLKSARQVLPDTYRRDHGRYAAATGYAYALAGDLDSATTLGRQAATIAVETGSTHTMQELRRMRRALDRWASDHRVRDLDAHTRRLTA